MTPVNWPKDFTYAATSSYYCDHVVFLENALRSKDLATISPCIENQTVHPSLRIKKITSNLKYKGPKPHPLANQKPLQRGVFASGKIPTGTELGEYVGMISFGVKNDGIRGGVYEWCAPINEFIVTITPEIANELIFINDFRGLSDSPNCQTKWILHRGVYYFGYETIRDIEPLEELLVDYGKAWEKKCRDLP